MGHRLPFHEAGCQNIHGHSYVLWVELRGIQDSNGMVMDYLDLKAIVQPIIDQLDHSFLCDERDDVMKQFFATNSMKVNYVSFTTTAENLARWIAESIVQRLRVFQTETGLFASDLKNLVVRVQETVSSYAELELSLS